MNRIRQWIKKGKEQLKNGKKWPWILAGAVLAVVLAAVIFATLAPHPAAANVQTVTVTKGSIAQTILGTGSLEYADDTKIELPIGIKVLEVKVKSGDSIKTGDILATVDPLSVQKETAAIQSEIETLDGQINSSKNDTESAFIRANVSGRVKKIYGEKGASVADTIIEHGALMRLSIDGKMAVDIETEQNLAIGDEVGVILSNGTKKTGTVAATIAGGYTVTITDNGPKLDEEVTVKTQKGAALGGGKLYIHESIAILGSTGTIKTIHAAENEMIGKGSKAITLTDAPPGTKHLELLAKRQELADTMAILVALGKANAVVAKADGTMIQVAINNNETIGNGTTADTGTSAADASQTASGGAVQTGTGNESRRVDAFTVAESDRIVLAVEVDELDILSVEKGQEAAVIFDALPAEEFIGGITRIAAAATNENGVAKYIGEITLEKTASMRAGMNATATIRISQKDGILTLPLEALQETAGKIFVYTALDEKTGLPTAEKTVTTGLSDGKRVEIVSGLADGDAVYYVLKTANTLPPGMGGNYPENNNNMGGMGTMPQNGTAEERGGE